VVTAAGSCAFGPMPLIVLDFRRLVPLLELLGFRRVDQADNLTYVNKLGANHTNQGRNFIFGQIPLLSCRLCTRTFLRTLACLSFIGLFLLSL